MIETHREAVEEIRKLKKDGAFDGKKRQLIGACKLEQPEVDDKEDLWNKVPLFHFQCPKN